MIDRRQDQRDEGHAWATRRIENNPFWSGVLAETAGLRGVRDEGTRAVRAAADAAAALPGGGERRADFIGRTESFSEDLVRVCERLGLEPPPQEPRRNAGPSSSYRDHFTPAMRDRVAELFEPDLREFGYEF